MLEAASNSVTMSPASTLSGVRGMISVSAALVDARPTPSGKHAQRTTDAPLFYFIFIIIIAVVVANDRQSVLDISSSKSEAWELRVCKEKINSSQKPDLQLPRESMAPED